MASKKFGIYGSSVGAFVLLVIAVVAINIISSKLYTRFDSTSDRIYSLSDGTKKILKEQQSDVVIKFYFSDSLKSIPVAFKTYASRVEEVLGEYASLSGGKITLETFDPKPDTDEEEWARKYSINGMKLPDGDSMFFGAVFIAGKKEIAIPYFDPRREEFLEYDISEALVQIQEKQKIKVGILSSLPVMGAPAPMQQEGGGQPWTFVEQLRRNFDVEGVDPATHEIAPDIAVLVVFHPKNLSDSTIYAIDQFVMRGGRLIVAVDPMSRFDLSQSVSARMSGQMPQVSSDFQKLFTAYGISYDPEKVVGDLSGMMQVNAGGEAVAYPYFVNVRGDGISRKVVATQSLNHVMLGEGGELKKAEGSKYEFLSLLESSLDSGLAQAMMAFLSSPGEFARQLKPDNTHHTMAALITGNFESAFPNGAPKVEGTDDKSAAPTATHQAKAKGEGSIFVIADTDFIYDPNAVEMFRFGPQTVVRPRNDNLPLILNMIEYLGGNENLISIRSRGKIARPFIKVEEIQKQAQLKWQKEEERLSGRLAELQKKLAELQGERTQENRLSLSPEQQAEIARFREEEAQVIRARREVRKNLREDIERLGSSLVALNMGLVPLAVGAFGFMVFIRRSRRMKRSRHGQ